MSNHQESGGAKRSLPRYWITLARLAVAAVVCAAVIRAVLHARQDLTRASFDWTQVRWPWLVSAGLLYAASQVPMTAYWRQVLAALGITVRFGTALRGYVAGQLGKYVPGKLMVVVIRSSLLQLPMAVAQRAVSSVFIETFTYMAVGAFLAGMGGFLFFRQEWVLQVFSLNIMIAMVLLTSPKLIQWLIRRFLDRSGDATAGPGLAVDYSLVMAGWGASLVAWMLATASLCATLCALPPAVAGQSAIQWTWDLPLRLGTSLAAAVVLGFASLLPGGLGAREYVLDRLLVPMLGEFHALTVTVLLRVIWLLTELVASTILCLRPGKRIQTRSASE